MSTHRRSTSAHLVALAVLLGFSCSVLQREERPQRRTNVVLMMSDDQGFGDLGSRGGPPTPALDALGDSGVTFTRFHAASPVCSPTRAAVLTGRHPHRLGIEGANVGHLPAEEVTLAEALQAAGYATGHFGKWHLGTLTTRVEDANRGGREEAEHYAPPWEHGFDVCFSTESKVPTFDPLVTPERAHGGVGDRVPGTPYGTAFWTGPGQTVDGLCEDTSKLVLDRALAFVRGAVAREQPFLAVIWFHAPHLPVVADATHTRAFADLPLQARHYRGALTALDESVARLRRTLRVLGVERDTMLWFQSDNGPEGGPDSGLGSTAGLRGRKRSLYEGGTRVPAFLVWPARHAGGHVVEAPVSSLDLVPTILSALALPPPPAFLDGVDLGPLLRQERAGQHGRGRPLGFLYGPASAWIDGRWKLVAPGTTTGEGEEERPVLELYDLLLDPTETTDVAEREPERVARMLGALVAWQTDVLRDAASLRD